MVNSVTIKKLMYRILQILSVDEQCILLTNRSPWNYGIWIQWFADASLVDCKNVEVVLLVCGQVFDFDFRDFSFSDGHFSPCILSEGHLHFIASDWGSSIIPWWPPFQDDTCGLQIREVNWPKRSFGSNCWEKNKGISVVSILLHKSV